LDRFVASLLAMTARNDPQDSAMHALFRLVMILVGFAAAVLAASFVLVYLEASNGVRPSGLSESQFNTRIVELGFFVAAVAAALCLVPALVFALLAEAFRWRWLVVYGVVGGLLGAFCLIDFFGIVKPENIPIFKEPTMNFIGGGVLGGLVYWFITGRFAGFRRDVPPAERTTS
jgi:hypothetical protein